MPTGKVSFYDDCRGYGFIIPDDGPPDVFVHAKFITNASMLKKDQRVSYEVVHDASRGKPRADRVRVIDNDARTAGGFDAIAHDNDFLLSPFHD
jgi:CspA family cold shock protein